MTAPRAGGAAPAWTIDDLRDCPAFFDIVAERIWTAWDSAHGFTLEQSRDEIRPSLDDGFLPICFVAHHDGRFLATSGIIVDDLDLRPHYSPWLANVWVEPAARGCGLGAAMVNHAMEAAFAAGIGTLYLHCIPPLRAYYAALDWPEIEAEVGPKQLSIRRRLNPAQPASS